MVLFEWLQWDFMRQALVASLLASIACGIIGSLVVVNRMVFLAGGISHAAYGGIGIAIFLNLPMLPTVFSFSVLCALLLGHITLSKKHYSDAIVGAIWAIGMALGALLVSLTPGFRADLMGYLFGNILTILPSDISVMTALDILLFAWMSIFYKEIVAISYDEEYAQVIGIPTKLFYYLILLFASSVIILLMRFVGLILVLAMLSIPSYLAEKKSKSIKAMMIYATIISFFLMSAGLIISYFANLPTGPTIILLAGLVFLAIELLPSK